MKRTMPWSDEEADSGSSDSLSDFEADDGVSQRKKQAQVKSGKPKAKSKVVDYEALKACGYKGGPSVLRVPPPKEAEKEPNWSWSTGREDEKKSNGGSGSKKSEEEEGESYEQRQKTRAALASGEKLENVLTRNDKKNNLNMSFSQKEKRKRELGQASRGKNYVEEEKRLLRDSGVYSGFDT